MSTQRPQNFCRRCGATWYPRGADVSRKCPECESRRVGIVGEDIAGRGGLRSALGCGLLAVLAPVAVCGGCLAIQDRNPRPAAPIAQAPPAPPPDVPITSPTRATPPTAPTSKVVAPASPVESKRSATNPDSEPDPEPVAKPPTHTLTASRDLPTSAATDVADFLAYRRHVAAGSKEAAAMVRGGAIVLLTDSVPVTVEPAANGIAFVTPTAGPLKGRRLVVDESKVKPIAK